MSDWSVEIENGEFSKFYLSLPEYERVVITSAITQILSKEGIGICASEWGKPLGGGLYEFRIGKSLNAISQHAQKMSHIRTEPQAHIQVLIRIFCTFYGDKMIVIHHGYDKKRDPSHKRQQREIAKARKIHERWKRS
ncbi:hypothetical protein M2118_000321 [Aurantimicrobium minutum]|uniref:hypothetical protein n=1 Tax=Aurantimicrobium minutum TaxID=708131 RepID=UPI002474E100|nr:hypothetical protein [Aurantimicrobium minutum]MDH6277370.1 hypothetical protein [Aurantimicrobium minutum]